MASSVVVREICVLALSASLGERWERVLEPYDLALRIVPVSRAAPETVADCAALLVTSDSALYWRSSEGDGAWGARLAQLPAVVLGDAAEPVLARLYPEIAMRRASTRREETRATAVDPAARWLAEPYRVQARGATAFTREPVPWVRLAPRARTAGDPVETLAVHADGALAVYRVGRTTFVGAAAPPKDLTAAGQQAVANLLHAALPPAADPPAPAPSPDARVAAAAPPSARAPAGLVPVARAAAAPRLDFRESFQGAPESTQALRGRVALLVFWATWCGACRETMPGIDETARLLAREGVEVVAVSVDETPRKALDYVRARDLSMPLAVAGPRANDRFGVAGIPSAVLLDRRGRIRGRFVGGQATTRLAYDAARALRAAD